MFQAIKYDPIVGIESGKMKFINLTTRYALDFKDVNFDCRMGLKRTSINFEANGLSMSFAA